MSFKLLVLCPFHSGTSLLSYPQADNTQTPRYTHLANHWVVDFLKWFEYECFLFYFDTSGNKDSSAKNSLSYGSLSDGFLPISFVDMALVLLWNKSSQNLHG